MQLVDTHCHIHETGYPLPMAEVEARAMEAGVTRLLCVGTDAESSRQAVEFVQDRTHMWASVGLHPHEAKDGESALSRIRALLANDNLQDNEAASGTLSTSQKPGQSKITPASVTRRDHFRGISEAQPVLHKNTGENRNSEKIGHPGGAGYASKNKIIAIGECGLDYFYTHSPKEAQIKALHSQIELALEYNLPLIFHVRDAFEDFWPIFDSYQNLRGVLHSFTDTSKNLEKALARGLYIGVNGIITFTKNDWQRDIAKAIPLQKLLLETDAPYLTPVPLRGTVNEPAHVRLVAHFLANLRGEPPEQLAQQTTSNAQTLFHL